MGTDRLCCCIPDQKNPDVGCTRMAEFVMVYGPGPDDYTETCLDHIPDMLPDASVVSLYRIPEVPKRHEEEGK